jgi:hypothetical protein
LITYVGVTPNKSYKLYSIWAEYNYGEGEEYLLYNTNNDKYWISARDDRARILISWSPTINAKSPNITDY